MPPSFSVPVRCAIESSGSEGGMLTLADCSFGCVGGGGLTYALVVVGGGMMEMEECMITDMRFERQPFEFCGSSEIRLLEDEFVNAELKGHALFGLEAEEGGDENGRGNSAGTVVKMNGTQFRGVVLEDTNEACIVSSRVGLNVVVVADGCLFEGVRSELSSEGGAIGMVLGEGGMLEVVGVETKAKGCACEAVERGKGGFVCVELQGEGSGVLFEEMEFEGNDAWVGRDMFVKCADLTEVVNETSFGFAKEIGEDERKNSLVGVDGVHFGDGEDLFVFITGYYGEVVYVDGKEGVNNIGEGEGMRRIVVGEMCWTERETTLKMVGVESDREDKMSVMEVEEVVEKEKGMVFAAEGASFLRVNFSLPGRLANGQRALIGVCGEGAWVEVRECVFSGKKDCVVGFHLVAGEDGDVGIVKCEVCDVVTESALFVFEESEKERNGRRMELEGCRVRNVRNRKDEASVASSSVSEGVFVGIGNSTIELCSGGSKSCGEGLVEGCEAVEGKGGGVYLRSTVEEREALGFVLGNVEFGKNKALVGRDVYVRCWEIESQISERQFVLDLREPRYDRENAIWGGEGEKEEDLIPLIVVYRSELIFVCGADGEGSDSKPCGNSTLPCRSLDYGLSHVLASSYSQVLIDRESGLRKDCQICSVAVKSLHGSEGAKVVFREEVEQEPLAEGVVECSEEVWLENMGMVFRGGFRSAHECLVVELNGSCTISRGVFSSEGEGIVVEHTLVRVVSGRFEMRESRVEGICGRKALMRFEESSVVGVVGFEARELDVGESVMWIGTGAKVTVKEMECWDVVCGGCSVVSVGDGDDGEDDEGRGRGVKEGGSVKVAHSFVRNIRRSTEGACAVEARLEDVEMVVANCSFGNNTTPGRKGQIMSVEGSGELVVEGSLFEGKVGKDKESLGNAQGDEMCRWNGSLVELVESKGVVRDTTVRDGAEGGMGVVGGSVVVEKGVFEGNRPLAGMEKYPSYRRNILCSGMGEVDVVSVKGGDGMGARSSMWMLNEGCNVKGITEDRGSSFFIPTLREVRVEESSEAENVSEARVRFVGSLLIPCNLSFRVVVVVEDVEQIECFEFEEAGHVSEDEAVGKIPLSVVSGASAQTEVKVDGEDRIAEGGKGGKFSWVLIVCVVIVVILLIALIISIIRWRKAKNENKDLREIVDDNIRKDPKAFEMVTMEMSPEEQWRRAEREAEKKNEERIKKRMNGKEMVHSESEEYLLSESGSTEYILGKDSDKIPDWALEKVEEEEIRKQTPSPSTSTTSTTDSDSTFVRGEDLCPTTSSMSNLVDAMACSSPHEKLIVDLRDSLFMLLHGRNEKKEMAIGSLQQREQTAAQILFWVANLALHSFDEMENGLSSLANLSPHIVLFSEHMVICIALHSDCSSDSDTSSSISSTTVVTSASDDDDDSLPSSAFEDEDDSRKECLRWKAPELLINKNMGATKESVAFSIGMMLWECLTLEIPFGEYEAEVAGQKIVNGERPRKDVKSTGSLSTVVGQCLSAVPEQRPTLAGLKREFIQRFPAGGLVMTVSDAVDVEEDTNGTNNGSGNGSWSLMSER
ncbi:uncharacterized protein MONOS_18302 [Monocercomonoides exilis]|uniref:uncharacterized protein n=2 Tax=Monocercomonoides exilis TaxID=2049356 RepID=UPI00355A427A|nr:hypothetical protein MONOS_18302 [Monocercomonoides exilis]